MSKDVQTRFHEEWLGLAQPIEGLVFSVPVLADAQITPAAGSELTVRFKEHLVHVPDPTGKNRSPALEAPAWTEDLRKLFVEFLGYDNPAMLVERSQLPENLHFYAEEGRQDIRPSFAIARGPFDGADDDPFGGFGDESAEADEEIDPGGAPYIALVWDLRDDTETNTSLSLDKAEDLTGPWKYPPTAKFERLLRHVGVPIGLVSNGRDLRLIYAPAAESTSHLTFRFREMVEPAGRPVLAAFQLLLGARRMYQASADHTLEGLLRESRRRQADVTKDLAAQVFEAVELLLEGFEQASLRDARGGRVDWLRPALEQPHDHLYQGVLSVVLRLVFLLYAEDQGLLPVGHPTYAKHLSIQGLYDDLVDDAGMHPESMHHRFGAYGRLLSLFRAVFLGVRHDDLELPPRQGKLFDPSSFPFLEGGLPGSTAAITHPEARAEIQPPSVDDGVVYDVLQRLVLFEGQRLSYRALDVEQIGSVYESLMGYHIVRVGSPSVRVESSARSQQGKSRARAWIETASFRAAPRAERKSYLKEMCGLTGTHQARVERALGEHGEDNALAQALSKLSPGSKEERSRHLVGAGRLVLQPGEERRRSGSHYTPRSLTERIVRRTLEPILACLGEHPTEEQLLSVKLCDPAMGSGAFLVETCRQLADELVSIWTREGRIAALAEKHSDPHLHGRRLVAQQCIYGVDKNEGAVELAKLSLWLVTMSAELPFTFVDHALRHGDSLVGLDLHQVASFHWERTSQIPLFAELLRDSLEQALDHRQSLHRLAECEDGFCQSEKRRLLDHADYAIERIRAVADVCVGAFFSAATGRARETERQRRQQLVERWLAGDHSLEGEVLAIAGEVREQLSPCHWWLEFPEVFFEERPDPLLGGEVNGAAYMEGIIGNPPFAGKNTIKASHDPQYIEWLKQAHPGAHGNSDLSAHFFRRSSTLLGAHGALGLIATNTIGQGDTRETGLRTMCAAGWQIYSAIDSMPWPGAASVTVSVVHAALGEPANRLSSVLFRGKPVEAINSRVRPKPERPNPLALAANAGTSFIGSYPLGMGFVLPEEEVATLTKESEANARLIRRYVNSQELSSSPTESAERWIIDFGQRSLEEAGAWPELLRIVEERVRPGREQQNDSRAKRLWWLFKRPSADLYRELEGLNRCIVSGISWKHRCFTFAPANWVLDQTLIVFPQDSYSTFGVLESRIHGLWSILQSGTFKEDQRYNPSRAYATFPFPRPSPGEVHQGIENAARDFYAERCGFMKRNDLGLTRVYNAMKDPENRSDEILELRRLSEALDRAVLDAYGWNDIGVPPYSPSTPSEKDARQAFEDEVLDRLHVLNAVRGRAEERLGLGKKASKQKARKKATNKGSSAKAIKKQPGAEQGSLLPEDS